MKLDCYLTTIYAAILDGRYRGTIYKSDLESANPYNTYRNPGLPPGPIANPGVASLKSALHPANTGSSTSSQSPMAPADILFPKRLTSTLRPFAAIAAGDEMAPSRKSPGGTFCRSDCSQ